MAHALRALRDVGVRGHDAHGGELHGGAPHRPHRLAVGVAVDGAAVLGLSAGLARRSCARSRGARHGDAPGGSPTAILLGKLVVNLLLLVVIELVTVPLFLTLIGAPPPRWGRSWRCSRWQPRAVGGDHAGRRDHRADARAGRAGVGASFPLVLPVLAAAVTGTKAQWAGESAAAEVRVLAAYAGALLAMRLVLSDHLGDDVGGRPGSHDCSCT